MIDAATGPPYAAPVVKDSKKPRKGRINDYTADLGDGFGARLRRAREAAQLTQEELAAKAGVNRVTIANWELGEGGGARADQVKAVALALGAYAGELLFGPDRRRP